MDEIYNEADLWRDLYALGIKPGIILAVHSSLSAIGYVPGGPLTVINALQRAVGPKGTLLMPTHTPELTGPEVWSNPPMPVEYWNKIRESLPLFDPDKVLPVSMGIIPCTLLGYPKVRRSFHPLSSFAALGKKANYLCEAHSLLEPEGWHSPIGKLYELDGWVLLLGVDNRRNTSLHLSEIIADVPYIRAMPGKPNDRVKILDSQNKIRYITIERTSQCSEGFFQAERYLNEAKLVIHGKIGDAPCQLMRQRPVVDLLANLLKQDPTLLLCDEDTCRQCSLFRRKHQNGG